MVRRVESNRVPSAGHVAPRVAGACLALVAMTGSVWLAGYELKDGDSRLYAKIANHLANAPLNTWLAPTWPPGYCKPAPGDRSIGAFYGPAHPGKPCVPLGGLFLEHPAVFFWPAAALGVLGLPQDTAILAANFTAYLLLLGLLWLLTLRAHGDDAARVAPWLFALSSSGMTFLVRGNHEIPLAVGVVAAAYSVFRADERWVNAALTVLAVTWCFAVKGVVGLMVLPVLLAWWWWGGRSRRAFLGMAAAAGVVALYALLYDQAYRATTGEPFLATYLANQTGYAGDKEQFSLTRKVGNLGYYVAAILAGVFPASLLWLVAAWRKVRGREEKVHPALLASVVTALLYCVFFALFDRRASRYVFGALPFVAVSAAPILLGLSARVTARLRPWLGRATPWFLVVLVVVTWGRIYVHTYHHRFVSLGS
jgi:4-amino-4-deoxy-L-arabinose transferase-like glycosyltransferase